ncbi:sigma-54 factor interaction domain-containing protein, partial [candidate division KSB1 bacterium]
MSMILPEKTCAERFDPHRPWEFERSDSRAPDQRGRNRPAGARPPFHEIVGQSQVWRSVLKKISMVAKTDCTVLIEGESGTGKELVARALHGASERRDRPMVKVNCAAIPADLIESEFFGHEKGAFTGATVKKIGRFELADNGTLFLDEIGELPLALQGKLLRVLQEQEFERVGGLATQKVDVRLIAATNRDLALETRIGRFRQDL